MIKARKIQAICPSCDSRFTAAQPMPAGYGIAVCISSTGELAYTADLTENNQLHTFSALVDDVLVEEGKENALAPQEYRRLFLKLACAPDENGVKLNESVVKICPSCGSMARKSWQPLLPEQSICIDSVKADTSQWMNADETERRELIRTEVNSPRKL